MTPRYRSSSRRPRPSACSPATRAAPRTRRIPRRQESSASVTFTRRRAQPRDAAAAGTPARSHVPVDEPHVLPSPRNRTRTGYHTGPPGNGRGGTLVGTYEMVEAPESISGGSAATARYFSRKRGTFVTDVSRASSGGSRRPAQRLRGEALPARAAHGIERKWDAERRLRRGYPKYWVSDAESRSGRIWLPPGEDPSLPPFRT